MSGTPRRNHRPSAVPMGQQEASPRLEEHVMVEEFACQLPSRGSQGRRRMRRSPTDAGPGFDV